MEIISVVIDFFKSDLINGLLLNLFSSWAYDKRNILSPKMEIDEKLKLELADVLRSTLHKFYTYKELPEYDDDIVLRVFCKEFSKLNNTMQKGNVRKAIELTIGFSISDDDFARWAEYFRTYYVEKTYLYMWITSNIGTNHSPMYYDDDMVFCRIEAMLLNFKRTTEMLQHNIQIDSIFEKINEQYLTSWKNDVWAYYTKLTPYPEASEKIEELKAYIRSNEDCDLVLAQLKNLLSKYDKKKSNREAYQKIQNFFRYPRYNMLQIISGTSGSGKSSWIEQYFKFSLEKTQTGALYVVPIMIQCPAGTNADKLNQAIQSQIYFFLGQKFASLEETNKRLQQLGNNGVKFCFIIDDIHIALDHGLKWNDVVSIIKQYSCYDSFKWMITVNEYELYLLETNPEFLKKYCITLSERNGVPIIKDSFSKYVLSLDMQNRNWKIVKEILYNKLNIDTNNNVLNLEKSISTPMEAKIFCACLKDEDLSMISLPSTYFDFFIMIAEQKNKQMQKFGILELPETIEQVVNTVLSTHTCTIDPNKFNSEHLTVIRNAQLLIRETSVYDNVYSTYYTFPNYHYHLSIIAYWARIIAGKLPMDEKSDISIINSMPIKLSEWVIPCYIFRHVANKDVLLKLLPILKKSNMLDYALFLARRTTGNHFSKNILEYILENPDCIKTSRNCYAILYFINYSNECLSIAEKFRLLIAVSKAVKQNYMLHIYKIVFQNVVSASESCKNLKKNMLNLSSENIPDINYINGYDTANVFVKLWKRNKCNFDELFHEYVLYLFEHNDLIKLIKDGNNESFMDYFIRGCMENYIYHTSYKLIDVYSMLDKQVKSTYEVYSRKQNSITKRDVAVVCSFYYRNFTCAAGNVFSNEWYKPQNYEEQYVRTVATLIQSNKFYSKKTAWHLLSNSKKDKKQQLNTKLQKYAEILKMDPEMQEWLKSKESKAF